MTTIRDIARMAGVSISTVSHVVNKTRFVSPELVERVESVIAGLDPPPNFIVKKNMLEQTSSSSRFVILINIGGRDQKLEAYIEKELLAAQLAMVSISFRNSVEKTACQELLRLSGCAGMIIWTGNGGSPLDSDLMALDLPRVVVGLSESGGQEDVVFADVAGGTYQAVLHLLRSGHEQIAFLSLAENTNNVGLSAYRRALESFDVPYAEPLVYLGLSEERALFSALEALFGQPQPPTALYVAHADIIVPLLRYLEANNIRCPEDVSIICLGDFDWSILYSPAITAVRIGQAKVAKRAVERLVEQITQQVAWNGRSRESMKLSTKLILRASTTGIPRGPFGEKGVGLDCLQLTASERAAITKGNYTAAISFHYSGRAWNDLITKGMMEVFHTLGINIIATTDAHFDPELQCRQLESLSLLQPSIVVGMPTDDTLTAEPFRSLMGTSKLIFLGHVPRGFTPNDYVTCVSVNDREYGRYAAQSLVEHMQRNGLSNVGMLLRGGRFFATNQRDAAAEQLFSERENIKICGAEYFELEHHAYSATLALMRSHPEIHGLYVSWEGPAREALRALQELGRTDVAISTCDLEYQSAMAFATGGMIRCISAQRPYEQGKAVAMAAAISLLERKVPTYIAIEPVKITHTNLLKEWKEIYKEDAPAELRECLRQTAGYIDQSAE